MNSADTPAPPAGSPFPGRAVPNSLAAGVLFVFLGFLINAAAITASADWHFVWTDFLHQNPDQTVSDALPILALAPFAGVGVAVALGSFAVITGAIVMAALIRILGTLPLWTLILVIPLCMSAAVLQSHLLSDGPWAITPYVIATQIPSVLACWISYRALAGPPASPRRAKLCRQIFYLCITLVMGGAATVAGVSVVVHWRAWHPEVSWTAATGVPKIVFANEWQKSEPSRIISWSRDGTTILTCSLYHDMLTVQDSTGHVEQEKQLSSPFGCHFAFNAQEVILPGNIGTKVAFSVVDIASGHAVFQEHKAQPTDPGLDQVAFAVSPNGSVLAADHVNVSGHPISLYDTKTWQKILVINVPATQRRTGGLAFSADGSRLVFGSYDGITVADARTGQTVGTLAIEAAAFALSPDNTMMAVEERVVDPSVLPKGVRIFHLADGAQIASHAPPYRGPNCAENIEDCGLSSPILWAPSGRFLVFPDGYNMTRIWNPFGGGGKDVTIRTRYSQGSIAFSPDGGRLAISNGDFVSIFYIDR